MFGHRHPHTKNHPHEHDHRHPTHVHTHGAIDPSVFTTQRGHLGHQVVILWITRYCPFSGVIVFFSGSVALLVDTIHNIGDAATAIPLWIAFTLARLKPSKRFTYGSVRVEDLAGVYNRAHYLA